MFIKNKDINSLGNPENQFEIAIPEAQNIVI